MSFFGVVVLVAVLATVFALITGVSSMVANDQVGHLDSVHWMQKRVEFQAAAVVLVLVAAYFAN